MEWNTKANFSIARSMGKQKLLSTFPLRAVKIASHGVIEITVKQ